MVARLAVIVCLWSGASLLCAAQAGDEPDVLRVGAQLVQVNVVVTDDDGPVHDLTADDFTVLDDGVVRTIEVFEVIRSETGDSDAAAMLPDHVVSNRLDRRGRRPESATAILVDRLNTLGPDQAFMDDQVRTFLDEAAAGGEHVAVLELREDGLTVLADFTNHASVLRNALESRRPSHSLAMESSQDFFMGGLDPVLAEAAGESTGDEDDNADGLATTLLIQVQRYYMNRRVLLTAAALEAGARYLSPLPGRKNLVWLSAQFPFPYRPWQDPRFNIAGANLPPATLDRIEDVFRIIVDSDVAVYPIDALGLRSERFRGFGGNRDAAADLNKIVDLPMRIAAVTGGRTSFNTNGLTTRMREAVRDMNASYSLGFYVPEVESDAEFHEIDVRVERDDVDVLHRSGYFGFDASPSVERALNQTLTDPFDATGIGLLAAAEPIPDETGSYTVTLAVDVNDIDLIRKGDHWAGSLTVAMGFYATSLDEYRRFAPVRHEVRLTDSQLATARQVMSVIIPQAVDTGNDAGHLRVAVQDAATGETGSLWLSLGQE